MTALPIDSGEPPDNDFEKTIRERVEKEPGDFVPGILANQIVDDARAHAPEQLTQWLEDHAVQFVHAYIGSYLRSERARAQRRRGARTFAKFSEAFARGEDVTYISESRYKVADGSVRKLKEMTNPDLAFVAADYEHRARSNKMEATFLRVLQRRIPNNGTTVGEIFNEDELHALRDTTTTND